MSAHAAQAAMIACRAEHAEELAVLRHGARLGNVVVHFPRLGYDLRPA